MNKIKAFIEAEAVLLVAVLLATFTSIGGTALVLGAVPDENGKIHACRSNDTGVVRIIDSEGQSCTESETEVDWSQAGSAELHDANGQFIGNVLDSRDGTGSPLVAYNPTLNRIISVNYSDTAGHYSIVNAGNDIYFSSDDCTGQPYTYDTHRAGVKTELIRTGDSSYGVVEDSATPQSITIGSIKQYDLDSDSFSCNDVENATDSFYEVSSVSLPFTAPIAGPFKF